MPELALGAAVVPPAFTLRVSCYGGHPTSNLENAPDPDLV